MYCPAAELYDTDAFFKCSGCDEVHCANHDFDTCAECEKTICYQDPSQCRICDEPLCEDCQMGDHEFQCMVEHGSSNPDRKLSAVEREILSDADLVAEQEAMEAEAMGW